MRKDNLIKNKLNILADSIILPSRILDNAIYELREANSQRIQRKSRRFRLSYGLSIAVILIVAVSIIMMFTGDKTYNLSSLNRESITTTQAEQKTNQDILEFDYEMMNVDCTMYTNSKDKVCTIEYNYTIISSQGTDQITVYADIEKGLTDYTSYKDYPTIVYEDNSVRLIEVYENGEYYTKAYYETDEIDYYIIIMSPNSDIAEEYFNNFS